MRRFHQFFGWALFVVFLLTGLYMRVFHNRLHGLPDGTRMLYRSRHIYILFGALLSLMLGLNLKPAFGWRRPLQLIGSILMIIAAVLLVTAFFHDPGVGPDRTLFSFFGVIITAVGVLLHLIGGSGGFSRKRITNDTKLHE